MRLVIGARARPRAKHNSSVALWEVNHLLMRARDKPHLCKTPAQLLAQLL